MSAVANTVAGAAALAASVTAVAGPACFRDWPAGTEPEVVGLRVARHFAENPPDRFSATGSGGASMQGAFIPYPISVLWANSIELSRRMGDKALEKLLAEDFEEGGLRSGEEGLPYAAALVEVVVFGYFFLILVPVAHSYICLCGWCCVFLRRVAVTFLVFPYDWGGRFTFVHG